MQLEERLEGVLAGPKAARSALLSRLLLYHAVRGVPVPQVHADRLADGLNHAGLPFGAVKPAVALLQPGLLGLCGGEDRPSHPIFVFDRTRNGRTLKLLTLIDEFTRESQAIDAERRLTSGDVIYRLEQLFVELGTPSDFRSENGPELTANALREWLARIDVGAPHIELGSPWENGYRENFNGKLRHRRLNGEIFYTFTEARVLIKMWRREYN